MKLHSLLLPLIVIGSAIAPILSMSLSAHSQPTSISPILKFDETIDFGTFTANGIWKERQIEVADPDNKFKLQISSDDTSPFNVSLKKDVLQKRGTISLPFIFTTSAFAQSLPTVSVNPNPINIGDVPVTNVNTGFGNNLGVEMIVKNTSQEDLILFAAPTQESVNILKPAIVQAIIDADPNSNNNPDLLKPGGKGRFIAVCTPGVVEDLNVALEIRGVTLTNAQPRTFATIPVKCKGVASNLSRRFSLKLAGANINDFVDIQVKNSSQQIVKQLKCDFISGKKSSDSSCDLQVGRGFKIEVKSNSPNFARFINATGSTNCQAKVCTFNLNEDSAVTASFKPTVSLPPVSK